MEGVALYHGEEDEMHGLRNRFTQVFTNWWSIMRRQKNLNFFTIGYNQAAVVFPFLVGAPRFFSGAIQMGGLIQISHAFGKVQDALSWFINLYSNVAAWRATVDRLTGFHKAIAQCKDQTRNNPGITSVSDGAGVLALDHVELDLPNGQPLLSNGNLTIAQGSRVLVQGPSGSGKSTLFRAIAGIWPFGRGRATSRGFNALFLPQRPYFPLGTLRGSCCIRFPLFSEEEVVDTLPGLRTSSRLDESANWAMQLCRGEQQRVAFACAAQKPAWLFLDRLVRRPGRRKSGSALRSAPHPAAAEGLRHRQHCTSRRLASTYGG
jgi:putative ATP-binding cassette transporter